MEKPRNEDCCGSGCNPCIFDVYEKSLKSVQPTTQVLNPLKYLPFLLKNIEELSNDTFKYTFETLDETKPEISLNMSNYAILRAENFSRPYTILSNDFLKIGCFQVIIRQYPNGKMSEKLKNSKIGDKLFWRGPYSHFDFEPTSHILLIGSGTGILPLFNIAKALTSDENCETLIQIIGCFRSLGNILLRNELHELTKFWNCSVQYFIEEANNKQLLYKENVTFRKLDDNSLKQFLSKSKTVVTCGSNMFNEFVQKIANECEIKLIIL